MKERLLRRTKTGLLSSQAILFGERLRNFSWVFFLYAIICTMKKFTYAKALGISLLFFGCATAPTEPKTPTTTPIVSNNDSNPSPTENPMSKAWLTDQPTKICPISGGTSSENASSSEDKNVTNGSAFDCYGFSFGGVTTIVIPDGVELSEKASAGTMIIKTNKKLAFNGHPPKPMSPETARNNMGLAYKLDGDKLTLATYGEFSTKEGGASMKLVIWVPPNTKVERQKDLHGPNSIAGTKDYPASERDYWYTGNKAAPGWLALKAVPDPGSR